MTLSDLKKEFLPILAPEDFFVLLSGATGKPREFLLAHPEYELNSETEAKVRNFLRRRSEHEPVAYIVGKKEFYGLTFEVTRATLIPRPETELLVERTIEDLRSKIYEEDQNPLKEIVIADIGTGSGAIIVSLAHTLKQSDTRYEIQDTRYELHATDISEAALDVTKRNAKRNNVDDIISFHHGNLIEPIQNILNTANDIILIANLPYLSHALYASASRDVNEYEPESALVSGEDGLDHYRAFFAMLTPSLVPGKHISILCEISPEQKLPAEGLAQTYFPHGKIDTFSDLSGQTRILEISLQ